MATLFQLLTVTSRAALPHTPQSTLTMFSCSTSSGGSPTEPISRRCVRSSVMTRTAPACAPASRIMVDRKRPSSCSTGESVDRLVVISDSTRSAGMLTLPESGGVCWIRGWMLSFMVRSEDVAFQHIRFMSDHKPPGRVGREKTNRNKKKNTTKQNNQKNKKHKTTHTYFRGSIGHAGTQLH